MADKRISELNALTSTASADLTLISDTSASETKKITLANLFNKIPTWVGFADTVSTSAADSLAIPITASICHLTTGGDAEALTLAAGTQGQIMIIMMIVDGGGTGTIAASATVQHAIAFADAGDTVTLLFTNSKWHVIGGQGCSIT
jgi:hypothetical protein